MTNPTPKRAKPKRYFIPYDETGAYPRIYEWFPGARSTLAFGGGWDGNEVEYEETMTFAQAKAELRRGIERDINDLRAWADKWSEATPDEAVKPHE